MKNTRFLVVGALVIASFLVLMCEKQKDTTPGKQIKIIKAQLGGCNLPGNDGLKDANITGDDSTRFTVINNDTLDVFVGISFLCCAGFDASTKIGGDTITISLTDTCNDGQSCYCKCDCFYTWDFIFADFDRKSYYFTIMLYSKTLSAPRIITQGKLDLKK